MKLGLYLGSFDPFHKGHFEVIDVMLQYVDKIAILPNNPNKNKPKRSAIYHRINMIKMYLNDYKYIDKIDIIEADADQYVNTIDSNIIKIGIMGSDCYNKLIIKNQIPKLNTNQWYIIPRSGYVINKVANWMVPIMFLPECIFNFQHYSSTMIREFIYDTEYDKINTILNDNIVKYMIDNKIYPDNESLSLIRKKIKDVKQIIKIKNNVYDVHTTNNRYIVKMFNDLILLNKEMESNYLAQSLNCINVAKIIDTFNNIIIYEYVGKTAFELLQSGNDPYEIGRLIGQSLYKLHNYIVSNISVDLLDSNYKLIKLKNKLGNKITNILYNSNETLGLTHGDCNLHNFIVDLENKKVIMIDIGHLIDSYIDNDNVNGLKSYDYYQFLSSIKLDFKEDDVSSPLLKKGFKFGYDQLNVNQYNNVFIDVICKKYWELRSNEKN